MKRNYTIGSEWMYFKIYTGVKTTDFILTEKLFPIIEELKSNGLIQKWFFIRYRDPSEHFRIRFLLTDKQFFGEVLKQINAVLEPLQEENLIWKIQMDTYQREIERYGKNTIEVSESIFQLDSELVLEYLQFKNSFIKQETQLVFSFLAIDSFLNSFSFTLDEKHHLLELLQNSFKKEFHADKTLKKELDKSFRTIEKEVFTLFDKSETIQEDYQVLFSTIEAKEKQLNPLVQDIVFESEEAKFSFFFGHIHMMMNRQYTSKQRMYELVVYDHLFRYYKVLKFRKIK